VDFFCSEQEPLPWVEPELLFFCLELEDPLPDLLLDLLESDLLFGLVSRRSGSSGFAGEFSFSFPVSGINSLDKFSESNEGVQLFHGGPYCL